VNEAESHAEEDKQRKQEVETRNMADSLLYNTEKTLREHQDKVGEEDRKAIEDANAELRKALEGQDTAAIEAAAQKVTEASHKLAEVMYAASQSEQAAEDVASAAAASAEGGAGDDGSQEAGPVDADFTVVDEEEKKS